MNTYFNCIRHSARLVHRAATIALVFNAWSWAHAADAPVLLGQLALGAPSTSLNVTSDGSRLLIQMRPASGRPAEIQVIDTSNPSRPVTRGRLTIRSVGELALSNDGRSALLAQRTAAVPRHAVGTYEVTSLDLNNPDVLRASWKREVGAMAMALAPDASAFAYTRSTQPIGGQKEAILVRADGADETSLSWRGVVGADEEIRISPGARFVAFSYFGWTVENLSGHPPAEFERPQAGFQSDGCLLSILSSGHVLVEDLRAARFGVYSPQRNLPRIAKLAHGAGGDGSSCQFTTRGRAGDVFLLQQANGALYTFDVTDAQHPRMSKPLLLPHGSVAAGMDANRRIYALRNVPGASRLEIYDTTRTALPVVDWVALERVRREALQIYADKRLSEFLRQLHALHKFEDAGTLAALSAPVTGVSNNIAAAILNDYAFLLRSVRHPGDPDVRALLRRSIELNPKRRIAYLNLTEALRQSLPVKSGPQEAVLAQAGASYNKYLKLGGAPVKEMLALTDDRLYRRRDSDICRAIVDFANAGRLGELIRPVATDVPADGRKLDLVFTTEGSAHVPAVYAWDASDDSPLERVPVPNAEGLWGGDQLGLIVYRDVAHVLHYRDLTHPVASIALSGGQTCDFNTSTAEQVGSDSLELELCTRLTDGIAFAALEFDGPAWMTYDDVSKVYGETELTGSRKIDVTNDGNPVNIGRFQLSSGSGAGCDETFFDQLDSNAAHFQRGPQRDQLMTLQGADAGNRYPVLPCGNQPRFFAHKGSIYFETKPLQWPPEDQWNSYHRVTRIRHGQVENVCNFSFRSTVKLGKPQSSDALQDKQ